MEELKQWLISIVFASAAGALITVVSPKGTNDKTLKTVVGIFIIASVFLPLSKMNKADFSLSAFASGYVIEQGENEDFVFEMLEEELLETISGTTESFDCGIKSIEVDAEYDEEKCIIIHKITVYFTHGEAENIMKAAVETEKLLGVPTEVG